MTGFYNVLEKIKDTLDTEPFVNTVTYGNIDDVDLNKQSIFPLSHIIVNNTIVQEKTLTFNISVLAMDIVDVSKKETTDIFRGNDNEQDVLNTQLALLTRLSAALKRGDLYIEKYQLSGDVSCEPFVDRFDDMLNRTKEALDDFKKYVIQQARTNLTKEKKNVDKKLYNSLQGFIDESPAGFRLYFEMEDYGMFQDKGVQQIFPSKETPS